MGYIDNLLRGGRQPSCYMTGEYENDPVTLLCAEIVIHAIVDWRLLIKHRAWERAEQDKHCNFEELRIFFKSSWCDFIMQNFELQPARILEILEAELAEAKGRVNKRERK